jgi:hypothetical protein
VKKKKLPINPHAESKSTNEAAKISQDKVNTLIEKDSDWESKPKSLERMAKLQNQIPPKKKDL